MKVFLGSILLGAILLAMDAMAACGPRIRKAWSQYSANEKTTYKNAIEQAMYQGYHHKFVDVHLEHRNGLEAHDCMFIYWHRRFLWAYENMLRSLGPAYACVTLPFFDYPTLSSMYVAGQCNSMAGCSPLLRDFGATSQTIDKAGNLYGFNIQGAAFGAKTCVYDESQPLTRNFCESQEAYESDNCLQCMPRSDWFSPSVAPSGSMTLLSLFNQIFGASKTNSFIDSSRGIQTGVHNNFHATLDATMGTMASPADPTFYAHHTTIDALGYLYFDSVGRYARSATDRRLWPANCKKYTGETYTPTMPMTMFVRQNTGSRSYVDVLDPTSPIARFFTGVGRDFQSFFVTPGYGYDFTNTGLSGIKNLFSKPSMAFLSLEGGSICSPVKKTNNTVVDARNRRNHASRQRQDVTMIELAALARTSGIPEAKVLFEVEKMWCVYYNECLGGVYDYTAAFKKLFNLTESPRCFAILQYMQANKNEKITVPNWTKTIAKRFPCRAKRTVHVVNSNTTVKNNAPPPVTNTTAAAGTKSTNTTAAAGTKSTNIAAAGTKSTNTTAAAGTGTKSTKSTKRAAVPIKKL